MTTPRPAGHLGTILVLEREPYWAPQLRFEFEREPVTIVASHSLARLIDHESGRPSVLVWEFSTDRATMLEHLTRQCGRSTGLPLIVCAHPEDAPWEFTLRELGAVSWSTELRPPHELAAVCRRLVERRETRV